ncbi:MAG TPA: acyl-CoA dehydrogenase [Polyangiales bacterium]|nr:acyl-CoA dehydrogenase [Polyangiales bacterium]
MANPLLNDRDVSFLLFELFDAAELCSLPAFAEHSAETFAMYVDACRKVAREALFPAYRPMDEVPPRLSDGRVLVHPKMKELHRRLSELGAVNATRPVEVGGQQLPLMVAACAHAYLMAANLSAYGYTGLTAGAARLIESFGTDAQRRDYMARMYEGTWTGTMALTEPQAGSSLADVATRATPVGDGSYRIQGSKIFISGGDHDLTDNIVHMALARIEGAPPGVKGISLFLVPARRIEDGVAIANDTAVAGVIHKIGWRGLPSIALNFGENGDCRGYLVGEPNQGLAYMFQMMNEARLMVGLNGVSTAYVAYQEALEYAKTRPQGRTAKGSGGQVAIIGHADVRRMLLRQKAIVEGGLSLIVYASRCADLAEHAVDPKVRQENALLLDLLTPIAKSFPAEKGFEANALAVQIHGGYGYSSEYLPEAWLRDQKLNSIHEGTTGIQSLDLLGRKVMLHGGAAFKLLLREIERAIAAAQDLPRDQVDALAQGTETLRKLTTSLLTNADAELRLAHSVDYLEAFSTVVIGWMWLLQATAAKRARSDDPFYQGKLSAAQYFLRTELPRVATLAALIDSGEDSYLRAQPDSF